MEIQRINDVYILAFKVGEESDAVENTLDCYLNWAEYEPFKEIILVLRERLRKLKEKIK